jgi:hypothetical protein
MSKLLVVAFTALTLLPASASAQSFLESAVAAADLQSLTPLQWQSEYDEARDGLRSAKNAKITGMFMGGAGVAMLVVMRGGTGTIMAMPALGLGGFWYYKGRQQEREATETLSDLEKRRPTPTTMQFDLSPNHRVLVQTGETKSLRYAFTF